MTDKKEEQLDEKTVRVLKRKGYILDKPLSKGAYGQVYKAFRGDKENNDFAAVKVMDLQKVSQKFKHKFLPRELAVIIEVSHPNIVQIYDIFRSNKKIYIFMEFVGGGDIAQYLKKHKAMNERPACVWFTQIVNALIYLHNTKFIAHRDIKIDNILLTEDKTEAKLTDFGFAKESWDAENEQVILSETFCGTEPYYSPQLVKKVKYDPYMADVWAMGVVLFAMINNKFPFHFGKSKDMLKEQLNPKHLSTRYTKTNSKHLIEMFERMMDPNESTRISISDVLNLKWIREKGNCKCK